MPEGQRACHRVAWHVWSGGARRALALHCALGHGAAWSGLARALPFTLTGFDFPGHGQSADWHGGGDYHAACTRIAATFCDGPTDLIGHSFGATVALRLAVERPGLVRSLTLVEPVFFAAARADAAPEIAAYDRAYAPILAAMEAGDKVHAAEVFARIWGGGSDFARRSPAARQATIDRIHLVVAGAPGIEKDSGGLLRAGRLGAVTAPLLLLRGADSPPVIGAIHRALIARLPDTAECVVPGAGHMVALTHPTQVAAAIKARFNL